MSQLAALDHLAIAYQIVTTSVRRAVLSGDGCPGAWALDLPFVVVCVVYPLTHESKDVFFSLFTLKIVCVYVFVCVIYVCVVCHICVVCDMCVVYVCVCCMV